MDNLHHDSNLPILNTILTFIAITSGGVGTAISKLSLEDLSRYDLISGIVLKWVSIISVLLLIILNFSKIITGITKFFKSPLK